MKIVLAAATFVVLCALSINPVADAYFVRPGNTYYISQPKIFIISTNEATYKVVCRYVAIFGNNWKPKYCQIYLIKNNDEINPLV